jgi:GH18 family chitinase
MLVYSTKLHRDFISRFNLGKFLKQNSLGGGSYKLFPTICEKKESFDRFVDELTEFVDQNNYDGIDLDWEGSMTPEHALLWSKLVTTLRKKLNAVGVSKQKRIYLFVALPCGTWFTGALDPEVLRTQFDFINLMAYDQGGSSIAGNHAALEPAENDPNQVGFIKTLTLTQELKIPKSKICIGLPFYGYLYANCTPYEKIPKNDQSKKSVTVGWREISLTNSGWKREYDPLARSVHFFPPDGKSFISADDAQCIAEKTLWAKTNDYGGVFCWAAHHDTMPDGAVPLTKAIRDSWKR